MKIKMTAQGGIYGTLELETVDTDSQSVDFPEDLLNLISSDAMDTFEVSTAQTGPEASDVSEAAADLQFFHLRVTDQEGNTRNFDLPQNALNSNPDIDRLVKLIWAHAKPVSEK